LSLCLQKLIDDNRDVKKQTANFPPVSVHPVLALSPDQRFSSVSIRPNGVPILHLSNGTAHTYDPALSCFVRLADRWYSEGSTFWQGRPRSSTTQSNGRGILASVEAATIGNGEPPAGDTQRPTWWGAALSLGHLETRIFAARALDSPAEYKQALLLYSRKIADEGFRAKAEELIRELFGPLYWKPPTGGKEETWNPIVLGMAKRDLLKEVLSIFGKSRIICIIWRNPIITLSFKARSKTLTKLAMDWQDLLKKASSIE
jgi:protein HIRA/HIR1